MSIEMLDVGREVLQLKMQGSRHLGPSLRCSSCTSRIILSLFVASYLYASKLEMPKIISRVRYRERVNQLICIVDHT